MKTEIVSIHYGELALKKKNRADFENKLLSNLRAKLEDVGIRASRKLPGRIIIEFVRPTPWGDVVDRIRNVFGFSSAYPVHRTTPSMDELESAIVCEAAKLNFGSFAVRSKRTDKKFPLTSPEINSRLGGAIKEKTGAGVDLENPEKTFKIEVLEREIFFSHEGFRGSGGLPAGCSGHVAALLSGGIDSPVASWMMMKRGLNVSYIHFHSAPFTNEASIEKVEDMVEKLNTWQTGGKLVLVPFGELQKKIVTIAPSRYRVLLYRRFMVRIASILAKRMGAEALVTGEALGQVASQTLSNMASVEAVSELPIFRPLVGMDKQEIVDTACRIGTYELSIQPHQDCCSFLQPPNPATRTTADELDRVEKSLDVDGMVDEALKGVAKAL